MITLLYNCLNLLVSVAKLWTVTWSRVRRKEVETFALRQLGLDCVERKMHWCTVLLKDKIVINYALITSKIH